MSAGLSFEKNVPASLRSTVAILGQVERADGLPEPVRVCGAGVVVGKDLVLTCNHVRKIDASRYSSLTIFVGADHTYDDVHDSLYGHPLDIVAVDDARDLLLLRVPGLPSTPVQLCADEPSQGEALYWIGHPHSPHMGPIVCSGILASKQPVPHYPGGVSTLVRGFRLDGTSQPGNSGGGLFDRHGRLAGLVCASPVQVNDQIRQAILRAQNGASSKLGGVDVVETVRALLDDLASTTRTGIAYAISVAELHSVLPRLMAHP